MRTRCPLRIALVTETFPPEINGVAMTLSRLVAALATRHEVTVVRPRQPQEPRVPAPLECGAAQVFSAGFSVPRSGFRFGLPMRRALVRRWTEQPPDVVHIATEGPLGLSALRASAELGLPVTSSFHTNFDDYSRHYGLGIFEPAVRRYLRWFHNRARRTLVPSKDRLESLEREGYRNLALFGRGVDVRLFDPVRRDHALRGSWGLSESGLALLHVGRLAPEKNIPLAFAAFERIRRARPDARLIVVGCGPIRQDLSRRCPEAIFTGALPVEDLARHYASADLFVFPSMSETFGNVALEAMASGLPVVAFDYAAPQRYIAHADNGWLVPFGDEARFLEVAEGAAVSSRTLATFGSRARQAALTVPWEAAIAQFEREIHAAVDEARAEREPSPETHANEAALRAEC